MLDSDPSGPAAQASSDGTAVRVAIGLFALVALFFALRAVPAGDPDLPSPQAQLAETADPGPQADRSGEVSASENSVPALAWTPAARDYELRYTDAQGKEISRAIRFDPRQDQLGVQLQGESPWQMPLGRGTATAEQPQLTRDLRLLLDQAAEQKVYFPGGGWVEAKRQVSALPPRTRDGETRLGSKTTAKLRGETRSGERFHGQLQAELWLDAEGGDLIALRVKQTLEFADHGVRQIAFSLRPSGKERKVGGLPAEFQRGARGAGGQFGEQAREVAAGYSSGSSSQPLSLPGGLETPTALALLGSGLLLLFCAFVARWLGPTSALCVFLSVAIVCVPLVVTAQDKTSFGQRFSDPTENEIGYTVLATVSVGVGAVFAFMTAPVWVPVAVGVAGVTAIGAYWFTRTPPIRRGKIVEKRYEPERTYLVYEAKTVFDFEGKATTVMVPRVVHDDEDYVIQIQAGEETSKVYVTGGQYAGLELGQVFDMDTMGGNRFDEADRRRATAAEVARLKAAQAKGEPTVPLKGVNDALRGSTSED